MKKHFTRIIALVLCLLLLASTASFAASVVSPVANSVVYADSILVSVKVTEKATVNVIVYEEKTKDSAGNLVSADVSKITTEDLAALDLTKYTASVFSEATSYTNTGEIGFYTKQLSNVKPGIYKVQVDTLNAKGEVESTISSLVAVKQKEEKTDQNIFQNQKTTALQFLQNMLKKVFK